MSRLKTNCPNTVLDICDFFLFCFIVIEDLFLYLYVALWFAPTLTHQLNFFSIFLLATESTPFEFLVTIPKIAFRKTKHNIKTRVGEL